MKLTLVEQSDLGSKHVLVTIDPSAVLVDVERDEGIVVVTETDMRGAKHMMRLPIGYDATALDFPAGTWDVIRLDTEIAGQHYRLTGRTMTPDAGAAVRENFMVAGEDAHYRYVLRVEATVLAQLASVAAQIAGRVYRVLNWDAMPGAKSYRLQIFTGTNVPQGYISEVAVTTPSYTVPWGLKPGTYSWRVQDTGGPAHVWSKPQTFEVL